MEEKFKRIKKIVEKELSCSAHDMAHVMRVYNLALYLAKDENIDLEVLKAASLLHDIARVKEDQDKTWKVDHAILSSEMAVYILKKLKFSDDKIKHIQNCIISHRYKTWFKPDTIEAKILFDADKLDSIGAIWIARTFVWVWKNNANIYKKVNIEEYSKDNLGWRINWRIKDNSKHSPQIEFETKIKFLWEKLHTQKAKIVCKERLKYYKIFLDRLEKEVNWDL